VHLVLSVPVGSAVGVLGVHPDAGDASAGNLGRRSGNVVWPRGIHSEYSALGTREKFAIVVDVAVSTTALAACTSEKF
jgi:hypothetical protein